MRDETLYREVARTLQVPPDTVRHWIADGTLEVFPIPDDSPWIHCFPTRPRMMRILRHSKKRPSTHVSAGQRCCIRKGQ